MAIKDITYIDNNIQYGVLIDWHMILRAYKALNCPDDVYNPAPAIRAIVKANCKWGVYMSKRRTGKTTNFLLIGLLLYWYYGIHTYYIRQRDDMIAPRNSRKLFDTIVANGYIEVITEGQYNDVEYRAKQWFLCRRDAAGIIIDVAPAGFCFMQSVQSAEDVKSVLNDPYGDWIIYDEFIGSTFYPNEFVDFFNLISTIKRLRRSAIISLLANTIDMYHIYFKELCIADEVQKMHAGEKAIFTTSIGTKIYVERIEQPETAKSQDEVDKILYYGFPNPKLAAITGDEWAQANYPHIPSGDFEMIYNKLYLQYSNKLVRLDIVQHELLGLCIFAHWATRLYDDSKILTADDRSDPRYIYRLGYGRLDMFIRRLFNANRVYYATNDVGAFVDSYIGYIRKIRSV